MAKRFTWDDAAAKYERLYLEAVRIRVGAERFRELEKERPAVAAKVPFPRSKETREGEEAGVVYG